MRNARKRAELWCVLIDIIKAMKLKVDTKRDINSLDKIESNLNKLLFAEIIKD